MVRLVENLVQMSFSSVNIWAFHRFGYLEVSRALEDILCFIKIPESYDRKVFYIIHLLHFVELARILLDIGVVLRFNTIEGIFFF